MSDWQPIETAPKDETRILLHGLVVRPSVDAGKHSTVIGYWTDFNTGGWVWYGAVMEFTHWQPLPEPPTKDAG